MTGPGLSSSVPGRFASNPYFRRILIQCVLVIRESFIKEYGSRVFHSSPCGPLFLHIEPNQLSLITRTHCSRRCPYRNRSSSYVDTRAGHRGVDAASIVFRWLLTAMPEPGVGYNRETRVRLRMKVFLPAATATTAAEKRPMLPSGSRQHTKAPPNTRGGSPASQMHGPASPDSHATPPGSPACLRVAATAPTLRPLPPNPPLARIQMAHFPSQHTRPLGWLPPRGHW